MRQTILLNNKLWVEELHLKADLLLLEGLRKTNWLEKLGAIALSFSYQNRLAQIEALRQKGVQ